MRLITQNLLVCNKRTCQAAGVVNFPLLLKVTTWSDYDDDSTMPCTKPIMAKLAEKLEWSAFRETVSQVSTIRPLTCWFGVQLDWGVNLPETFN